MERRDEWHFKGAKENLETVVKMISYVVDMSALVKDTEYPDVPELKDYDQTRTPMLANTAALASARSTDQATAALASTQSAPTINSDDESEEEKDVEMADAEANKGGTCMSNSVVNEFRQIEKHVQMGAEVYHKLIMDPTHDFELRIDMARNFAGFPCEITHGSYFEARNSRKSDTPKTRAWTKPYDVEMGEHNVLLGTFEDKRSLGQCITSSSSSSWIRREKKWHHASAFKCHDHRGGARNAETNLVGSMFVLER